VNDTLVMPHRPRIDRTDRWLAALGVVVFALVVGLFTPVLSSPATVAQLTIDNRGTWPVNVSIQGSDPSDWLPLGEATVGQTDIPDVIDPGAVWLVRFANGAYSYTERVNRSAIQANHWTIQVPTKIQNIIGASEIDTPPSD
jgi:hypothetical protein